MLELPCDMSLIKVHVVIKFMFDPQLNNTFTVAVYNSTILPSLLEWETHKLHTLLSICKLINTILSKSLQTV